MTESVIRWQVILERQAERKLKRMTRNDRRHIAAAIDGLTSSSRPADSKKLAGFRERYRLRVGNWRIIYDIENVQLIVTVEKIGSRGDVYKD